MITTKEAIEAATKLQTYCSKSLGCDDCCFRVIGGGCLIGYKVPGNWYIVPESLPDDERDFAKQLLNDGYVYISINFDADGRHVEAIKTTNHMPCKILRADDFPSLVEPANYMLSTLAKGYIDGYV